MLGEPDSEGNYKLSQREYAALLTCYAAFSAMEDAEPILKDRLKLDPHAWRDYRMIESKTKFIADHLTGTIPTRKLLAIRRELKQCRYTMHIGPDAAVRTDHNGVTYVNEDSFLWLLDEVVKTNCFFCEKTGKDVKRCRILQMITDVLHYDPDPANDPGDGRCQIAGVTSIMADEEELKAYAKHNKL